MTIHTLASYFEKLEKTSARLEITTILAELFRKAAPDEIGILCYLSLGRLAPKFEGIEFQLAEKMMVRVLALTYHNDEKHIRELFKKQGDLGDVVAQLSPEADLHQRRMSLWLKPLADAELVRQGGPLQVTSVYEILLAIAQEEGSGSQERKVKGFAELLQSLDPLSAKYVVRMPVGALRMGFSDMTILDALSWMERGDKSLRPELERAYNVIADIGKIAQVFREKGEQGLLHLSVVPGIPIRAQQSERLPTSDEILKKLGKAAVEYKLDGFRAQVHVIGSRLTAYGLRQKQKKQLQLGEEDAGREVRIFSRNLDNTTHMFPEIVMEVKKLNVDSVVLDGEAIGYDPKTGKHLPFQETIQRKRKHGIEAMIGKIPLRYYAFDLLELNGESFLEKPFIERRTSLKLLIEANKRKIDEKTLTLAEQIITQDPAELTKLFAKSVKLGFEGIMAKKLDVPYQAGARNFTWVKFKHIGEGKLADTIDCVVMGYYAGKGKRSGFGVGAFLVGTLNRTNKTTTTYKTVAKIGTGLTDEQWRELRRKCQVSSVKNKPEEYDVPKELFPDGWVKPELVVEIAADEITKSPLHTAGLALRFPRLVKFRDDKSAADATTVGEMKKLYRMQ